MGILDRGTSTPDRNPFIGDGRHKLAVERYFAFKHETHGFSIGCTLLVLETTNPAAHPVGSSVFKAWNIKRGPKYRGDKCDGELNEATKFLARLLGGDDAAAHRAANDALDGDEQYDGPNQRKNPLRGMVIDAVGVSKPTSKIDERTGQPKLWTDVTWYHNAQAEDPVQIAAMRAHLDSVKPVQVQPAAQAAAPQMQQPQYAQPQQPQQPYPQAPQAQYAYPGAPAPQQYAQPAPAPQYAQPQQPYPAQYPGAAPAPAPQQPYPPQGYAPPPAGAYPGAPTPQQPAPAAAPGILPPGIFPGR